MAKIVEPGDFDFSFFNALTVAVIGYGNQGRAQALNLRDSGAKVTVGARQGAGFLAATEDGFMPQPISEVCQGADIVMLTLPDSAMPTIFDQEVRQALKPGATVLFAHGFNIVFRSIQIPAQFGVALVSPKGAGAVLRREYLAGSGLAAMVAVAQDPEKQALSQAMAYANALGCFRSVVLETTFEEETHCDLFGEQTVLCGGIPELLRSAFTILVQAGYSPEAAYFECIHEAKLITDLIYAKGVAGMMQLVSDTAAFGGYSTGPTIIGSGSKLAMRKALADIRSGRFAKTLSTEAGANWPNKTLCEHTDAKQQAETVGAELRRRMKITDV